jgi:hypothetical protein
VRPPAEPGQDLLRQVSGLVSDLPEALRPGQHTRGRDREDEHQQIAAAPALPQIRDPRQHVQQAGKLPGLKSISAGHGSVAGMRN